MPFENDPAHLEDTVPRGALLEGEQVDIVRYRATMTYLCEVFESKTSLVVFDGRARQLPIPPTGRNLLVVSTRAPLDFIEPIAPVIAAVGLACRVALAERVQGSIPRARTSPVGRMQRPALDGPVDRRSEPRIL